MQTLPFTVAGSVLGSYAAGHRKSKDYTMATAQGAIITAGLWTFPVTHNPILLLCGSALAYRVLAPPLKDFLGKWSNRRRNGSGNRHREQGGH